MSILLMMEIELQHGSTSPHQQSSPQQSSPRQDVEVAPLLNRKLVIKNHIQKYWNYATEIYIHIYCIAVFEVLFYFKYIVLMERDQIKMLVNSFAKNTNKLINELEIELKDNYINTEICDTLEDNYTITENYQLEMHTYNYIILYTGLLAFIISANAYIYRDIMKLFRIFQKTFILMGVIGCFEYLFFTNIVLNYKIMDRNLAFCVFVSKIELY